MTRGLWAPSVVRTRSWPRSPCPTRGDFARPGPASVVLHRAAWPTSGTRLSTLITPLLPPRQWLNVFIESPSRAPRLCVAIDGHGNETGRAGDDGSWGVVQIGHFTTDFTTDFTFHDRGQAADGAASSASGAHKVRDRIASEFMHNIYLSDFETIDRAIEFRKNMVCGKEVDVNDPVAPAIAGFATSIPDEWFTRDLAKKPSGDRRRRWCLHRRPGPQSDASDAFQRHHPDESALRSG